MYTHLAHSHHIDLYITTPNKSLNHKTLLDANRKK